MIFVTIGTQLPFPRLIAAMDALAPGLGEPVIAQVGPDPGRYPNLEVHARLAPDRFDALAAGARVIVAHAGIGSVLSAKRFGKPLVMLPRQAALGEHRNDHQMATARRLADRTGLHVAWTAEDLAPLLSGPPLDPAQDGPGAAAEGLLARIKAAITAP